MLPIPYFHVVFTLPQQLAPLALQNKRVVYGILFRAVSETLLEVAADPKHLGAQIGFLTVLHTWGQNLQHHPHLHCVISGGGLTPDRAHWVHSGDRFLLPVKVLSRVFRGKFLAFLKAAFRKGKLQFHGQLSSLSEKSDFEKVIGQMFDREWVVYSKRPFGGPELVLRYLANYTHRVAISNHRILSVADGNVTFRWKDYAHGNNKKAMTLSGCEFLRRFFLHTLPKGFVRIRQYGFLANRQRASLLHVCQQLLPAVEPVMATDPDKTETTNGLRLCPVCRAGHLRTVERFSSSLCSRTLEPFSFSDSS
jgi:hypothetical protein